jgi:hypothetical protein
MLVSDVFPGGRLKCVKIQFRSSCAPPGLWRSTSSLLTILLQVVQRKKKDICLDHQSIVQ